MAIIDTALTDLTEAKSYLKLDTLSNENVYAEYVGKGDGIDKTFVLDNTPVSGSLRLYVDGELQVETTDYSLSATTVTFVSAPADTKPITANYLKAAGDDTFEKYDDELLEQMINASTRKVESYCNRAFIARTITENRIGNGDERLRLNWQPIASVSSVTLDGETQTAGTHYTALYAMFWLYRLGGWTKDDLIVITYVAGDCAALSDVRDDYPEAVEACLLILSDMYENRGDTVDNRNLSGILESE